ncbi:hypothetical protein OEA41_003374 [Lepraria neglecta]|uniref:Uncharacterized protein n=1 Tax=Lepraria neglecta TaxID=209136 RepID=A0AAD9Z478_9LECA|nr:hypothetical protein OEA41_003374 [Lepraria neglecta]
MGLIAQIRTIKSETHLANRTKSDNQEEVQFVILGPNEVKYEDGHEGDAQRLKPEREYMHTKESTSPRPIVTYYFPSTTIDLAFYNYRRTISSINTDYCVLAAIQDCLNRTDDWDQPMGPDGKIYSSGSVTLSLYPEENTQIIAPFFAASTPPAGEAGFHSYTVAGTERFDG